MAPPSDAASKVIAHYVAGDDIAGITDQLAGTRNRSSGTWKRDRRQVEEVIRDELRRR